MYHPARKLMYFGLVATTLAGAFGCNSHLLVQSKDPEVVIIDPPSYVPPPPVEPGMIDDAGMPIPPAVVEPLRDGAIADVVLRDAAVGPDSAGGPDLGPGAGRDAGPDTGPDLGRDARIVPDTNCPTPVPPLNFPENPTCQGSEGGLGEAFQKALWFLNVNKSGPGVVNTYVQWRGDAHVMDQHIKLDPTAATGVDLSQAFITNYKSILDPNGTGEVDLSGGFHDAGDFIKFGLTTGFTASTLAWSMYEYPESFRAAGLEDEAFNLLRWRLLLEVDLPR